MLSVLFNGCLSSGNIQPLGYIQMPIDLGDLVQLNRFGGDGWRLVTVVQTELQDFALLERPLPGHLCRATDEGGDVDGRSLTYCDDFCTQRSCKCACHPPPPEPREVVEFDQWAETQTEFDGEELKCSRSVALAYSAELRANLTEKEAEYERLRKAFYRMVDAKDSQLADIQADLDYYIELAAGEDI